MAQLSDEKLTHLARQELAKMARDRPEVYAKVTSNLDFFRIKKPSLAGYIALHEHALRHYKRQGLDPVKIEQTWCVLCASTALVVECLEAKEKAHDVSSRYT